MSTTTAAFNPNQDAPYPDPTSLTTNEILNQLTGGPTIAPRASPFPDNIGALQVANKLAMNPMPPGVQQPVSNPGVSLAPPNPTAPTPQNAAALPPMQSSPLGGASLNGSMMAGAPQGGLSGLQPPAPSVTPPPAPAPLSSSAGALDTAAGAMGNAITPPKPTTYTPPPTVSASPAPSTMGGVSPSQTAQKKPQTGDDILQDAYHKLASSYDDRTSNKDNFLGLDPKWLALAQGFLAPTRTGSFGESLGNAAGAIMKANETGADQTRKDLMARIELGKAMSSSEDKKAIQDTVGKLYTGPNNSLNLEMAKKLSSLTGDPKIFQQAREEDLQRQQREASGKVFKINTETDKNGNPKTTFSIDGKAYADYLAKAPDSVKAAGELADNMAKLKEQGMMADTSDRVNPFTYYLSSRSPEIQHEAAVHAKDFENGTLSRKDADKVEEKLFQRAMEYNRAQEARADRAGNREIADMLKMNQAELVKERTDRLRNTLTPEQLATFNKLIVPVQLDQTKAQAYAQTLDKLEQYAKDAPDGPIEGAQYEAKRFLKPNDPMVSAMNSLVGESAKAVTEIPKFSSKGTVYDEILHGKTIGNLGDLRLSRKNRLEQINRLREDLDAQTKLQDKILENWHDKHEYMIPKAEKTGSAKASDFKVIDVQKAP